MDDIQVTIFIDAQIRQGVKNYQRRLRDTKYFCNTLFRFYENIVFPAQAEYSHFLPILGCKHSCNILNYSLSLCSRGRAN